MAKFVKVGKAAHLPEGEAVAFEIGDLRVCVAHVGGKLYAMDGYCTHAGAPMGVLEGKRLVCPFHGGEFDAETGQATRPPARDELTMYAVRVNGEDLEVELPSQP